MVSHTRLILRWSWRDLRARWLQVAAIALVIGIGSGVFSGLSSVSSWRRISYRESFAALHMYDLHVAPVADTDLDPGALRRAVDGIALASRVRGYEPRLVVSTQVDASNAKQTILVQGKLVGIDVRHRTPQVGTLDATGGRVLRPSDAGQAVVGLDDHFAQEYHLPDQGALRLGGGVRARWVGRVLQPEYFFVLGEAGDLFAAQNLAVMFAPLDFVQSYSKRAGHVNDLVLTFDGGTDLGVAKRQLAASLRREIPGIAFEITQQRDDRVLRLMFDDVDGDQQFYDIFAMLIVLGATFAAVNMTSRVVEAQRREIGIQMALGVPRRQIALRPVLLGAQVALLGVVLGVGVGQLLDLAMRGLLADFFPLPVWRSPFQTAEFARGAALGFAIPFVATLGPVWRAVRVRPVDAIRTSHRTASSGLAPLLRWIPIPGRSTAQMPVRNVLRTPRRTLLTALGIGAALTTLVGVTGMVDSFLATIDVGDREILQHAPDRLTVGLDFFYPETSEVVRGVVADSHVRHPELQLRLPATLDPRRHDIDVFVQFVDFDSSVWRPTAVEGALVTTRPGVVLARKAADDLGAHVGSRVVLRHPYREGLGYRLVDTELEVLAIHPNPYRFVAYMDRRYARITNLAGVVNAISVEPPAHTADASVQRALFGRRGIASVQPVRAAARAIRSRIDEALSIFRVVQFAVLVLALLIAFNSSTINVDERRREHATMFAFGLPVRSVLAMTIVESVLVGALGTAIGIASGRLLLEWLIRTMVPQSLPEIAISATLAPSTIVTAAVLGVLAVTVAPLFTLRRLRRMDVPSTLRIVE